MYYNKNSLNNKYHRIFQIFIPYQWLVVHFSALDKFPRCCKLKHTHESIVKRKKKIQHFLYTMQKRMLVEREIFLTSSLQIKGILIHSLGICKKIPYHNWFYDCFQSKLIQPRCMRQVHMNNFVETRNHQLIPVFRILTVMCIYSITGTSMDNMLVTVLSVISAVLKNRCHTVISVL